MPTHSEDNKIIAKNTVVLYLRLIISLIIGLYTSRAILDALGTEDYGVYNIVGGFVTMLSIFTASVSSAAQRFITYAIGKNDREYLENTFSTFASLFIIIAVIIFLGGEALCDVVMDHLIKIPEERVHAAYWVYHLSLLAFSIDLMAIPYNATVVAYERMNFFAVVSIGESLFRLVIVFLLYSFFYDKLILYAVLVFVERVTVRLIYSIYCKKYFTETSFKFGLNRIIFNEVFSYSVWVIIGTSSAVLKSQGVNLLINNFFGVLMNAARGVSVQVMNVVNRFSDSIGTAIKPQITKSYASGDVRRSISLTFALAKVQGLLLVFLSLPIILETEFVLGIWLKDVPDYAVEFTRWALILCISRTLGSSVVPLLLATGKVKYVQLVSGSIMLLNLPASYIALRLGAEPVSTMIIGSFIELLALLSGSLFLKKYVNFPIVEFWMKPILYVFLVSVLSAVLPGIIRYKLMPEGFLRFFIVGVLCCILVAGLSYSIALDTNERQLVTSFIKKRLKISR